MLLLLLVWFCRTPHNSWSTSSAIARCGIFTPLSLFQSINNHSTIILWYTTTKCSSRNGVGMPLACKLVLLFIFHLLLDVAKSHPGRNYSFPQKVSLGISDASANNTLQLLVILVIYYPFFIWQGEGGIGCLIVATRKRSHDETSSSSMATNKEDDVFIYKMGVKVFKNVTHVFSHPSAWHIPPHAFDGCRDLVEVKLNENLHTIGTCAFENCTSLHSIKIPSNVTSIKDDAFQGCTSLSVVELNEAL